MDDLKMQKQTLKKAYKKTKRKHITPWKILAIICAVVMIVSIPLSILLQKFDNTMAARFGGSFWKLQNEDANAQYYTSDFNSAEEMVNYGLALTQQVEAEGAALLMNNNNALPLAADAKVSTFSSSSVNLVYGGTGSGKSSLLLMLCRLYAPSEGRVTVGGEDLADMPAAWVRDHVGVVLQEPFLFSRTIEENIGICGADRETVRKAAATACIASDIEQFANGYDTMVGERGVTLSGGQKQRVAIARMLTKKTPVMVFDDSLSAVDTQTDEHIREALNRDLAGTTTIIISHRITTLMDCDNILVLEHGKVLQRGTPQELLRQPGLFRQIYDMQMSIGEEEPA